MKFSKNMIISIIALGLLGTITSPALARPRSKKAKQEQERPRKRDSALPGVLMGAGAGAAIGGLAARSAIYAIPGAAGGAILGYLLIRAMRKKNNNGRDTHTKPIKTEGRPHIKRTTSQPGEK